MMKVSDLLLNSMESWSKMVILAACYSVNVIILKTQHMRRKKKDDIKRFVVFNRHWKPTGGGGAATTHTRRRRGRLGFV
jgi:hypothetical protein